jgi:serine/threonine-protein kinase
MSKQPDSNRTVDQPGSEAALDAGLAAAFGPESATPLPSGASVLETLSAVLPDVPHICLREPQAEQGIPPVLPPPSETQPGHGPTDRYQIQGEIAQGGMGVVLKGRDTDLGRDVAVKVLLETHAGRTELVQRFVEEAQIAGQLQHPGIVPVYELGQFTDRRPYFAMKLVKGRTLTALLADRADPAVELPRFTGIFEQVCQTLAYVHARGVIHRDLKPSNIMVGAFGEVQVMDWGLAKVLGEGGVAGEHKDQPRPEASLIRTARSTDAGPDGSQTQAGSVLGTPAYMAPEQARGDVDLIDERVDVFGLGALLCEILTGLPPFLGKTAEAHRKARTAQLGDALRRLDDCGADRELVALAKRCLAAEPSDRPRHAGEVAATVTAYRQSVVERLRQAELARVAEEARAREAELTATQERRARRLTVALAASVLLTALVGGGGWLWLRADREARLAGERSTVNEALNQATGLREQSRTATGPEAAALAAQAREQVQRARALVESGPADPTLAAQVHRLLGELEAEDRDRQLLAALDSVRLAQAETNTQENRYRLERGLPLYRDTLRAYGLPAGEVEAGEAAARIEAAPAAVREALLAALDEWIALAEEPGSQVEEPHLEWLRAVQATADSGGWGKQVREAAAEKDMSKRRKALERLAETADPERLPARALTRLAERLQQNQAETSALNLLRRAQVQHPADFWVNHMLGNALKQQNPPELDGATRYLTAAVALRPESAGAHYNLGNSLKDQRRGEEAIAEYHQALVLDPRYAAARANLGVALADQGKQEEALAEYRRAIALDPEYPGAHYNLGRVLMQQGKLDEAIAAYRQAIRLDPKFALAYYNLGLVRMSQGQPEEAIAAYRQAITFYPSYAPAHTNLGSVLQQQGKLDEAITEYRRAIALDPKLAAAHNNLGVALKDQGKWDEAIAECRRAIALDPSFAAAHGCLGNVFADQGKLDEATAEYHRALALDPSSARVHAGLGSVLQQQGKVAEAIAEYHRAIALDPRDAQVHYNLGLALGHEGRQDEAIAAYRQAIHLDPKRAEPHNNLGLAIAERGDLSEAIAEFRRAIALDPKLAVAHNNLGSVLGRQGKLKEAIAEHRLAITLDPKLATAHTCLGNALADQGQLAGAVEEYRLALALDPKDAHTHGALGIVLQLQGRFAEAVASNRRCLELLPPGHPQRALAASQLKQAEHMLALEQKLPEILAGTCKPATPAEGLEYAQLCSVKKLPAGAARLSADAFAADPSLADDLSANYRYNAACLAALVAAGKGEDAAKMSDKERDHWRTQALDWLRADLARWTKRLASGKPMDRKQVQDTLQHWQQDPDLGEVRDAATLTKLPTEERNAWQKLWSEVAALLRKAEENK